MYPTGTVTFLFTDLEDSSRLWDEYPEAMESALARHDAILRAGVEANHGFVVKTTGDGLHAVFDLPAAALETALECQKALMAHSWKYTGPLRVRMGLHTGQAQLREGDYYGPAVNRAARVMSVAAGGQILVSVVTAELARDRLPEQVSLIDLGRHRLRNLDRPEQLYQLQHPALPAGFPPLKSLRSTPNNLPVQLTSFIGREQETIELRQLLSPPAGEEAALSLVARPRLVTLTGPGGTGKTRLSLQVAGDLLDAYPDGVWLVELAALSDPELVVRAVADPLGLQEQPGRPLLDLLINYLRPKQLLLILDNCEHLLDACAQLADTLLHSCPRLTILASSREVLGLAGEYANRVRSLSLPAADGNYTAGELAAYDAIRLFVSRAEAVKDSFLLNDENALDVWQICRNLDGIPLAIELAAARVRVLTPNQILDRLDDRFRLLTGGSRTALPRQRTLQALIDWSYELLSESEQTLLCRLSVFAGGWFLEAAERVAGSDPLEPFEILDLLEQLVNKSLVLAKETDLGMRYSMLETIRQYAQEKLAASGEAVHLRDRHLAHFVEQQEAGGQALLALRKSDWVEKLVADNDNLRLARDWAIGHDLDSAMRLMAATVPRWSIILSAPEGLQYFRLLLERAETSLEYSGKEASEEKRRLYGRLLISGAAVGLAVGLPETIDYADRGAAIARDLGDRQELAWSLSLAASRSGEIRDVEKARHYHEEILALLPDLRPGWVKALILTSFELNFAAGMMISPEHLEQAWRNWESGIAMFRQGGEFWGLAFGYSMAAIASFTAGDLAKTQEYARRSLSLYLEIGDISIINATRTILAHVARQHGDLDQATVYYNEAIGGWRNIDAFGGLARCLECLAFVFHDRAQAADDQSAIAWLARSATLLGAAAAMRQVHNRPMVPNEEDEYAAELAKIKEAAGDAEFKIAWGRGQEMDPDEVVDFARTF